MVIKWHYKLWGPFGPIQIARVYGSAGEPIGYRVLSGIDLLPQEQREKFAELPDEFTFTQAEKVTGKGSKTINQWLGNWQNAGLLEKHGERKKTRYRKRRDTAVGGEEKQSK